MRVIVFFFVFIVFIVIVISVSYYILFQSYTQMKILYHINIYSCNRPEYLNSTISSLLHHLHNYDKDCEYNIIWYDQGTPSRRFFIQKYKLKNVFFLNPMGYPFSFQLSFSYSPTSFVMLLEDDWVIDNNHFNNLKYKNFITLSIKLIENLDYVSGIVLREFPLSHIQRINVNVDFKYMEMYIIDKPECNLSFVNGPSVYKTSILKLLDEYNSEFYAGQWFYNRGYRLALFNNSGCIIRWNKIEEYVFSHIGYTTSRAGLCNNYLY